LATIKSEFKIIKNYISESISTSGTRSRLLGAAEVVPSWTWWMTVCFWIKVETGIGGSTVEPVFCFVSRDSGCRQLSQIEREVLELGGALTFPHKDY